MIFIIARARLNLWRNETFHCTSRWRQRRLEPITWEVTRRRLSMGVLYGNVFSVYKVASVNVSISPESTRSVYSKYGQYPKRTLRVWLLQALERFYSVFLQEAELLVRLPLPSSTKPWCNCWDRWAFFAKLCAKILIGISYK